MSPAHRLLRSKRGWLRRRQQKAEVSINASEASAAHAVDGRSKTVIAEALGFQPHRLI